MGSKVNIGHQLPKADFEQAAYGFPICSPYKLRRYLLHCFRDIQHCHLHGKPYHDLQLWGFVGKTPQNRNG